MTHTYHIHGMTCKGCKNHVAEILSTISGVSKVTIDLEKAEATIETEEHFPIEKYQEALKKDGDTYTIHNIDDLPKKDAHTTSKENNKEIGSGKYYCPPQSGHGEACSRRYRERIHLATEVYSLQSGNWRRKKRRRIHYGQRPENHAEYGICFAARRISLHRR